jgi:hypothetical protein
LSDSFPPTTTFFAAAAPAVGTAPPVILARPAIGKKKFKDAIQLRPIPWT